MRLTVSPSHLGTASSLEYHDTLAASHSVLCVLVVLAEVSYNRRRYPDASEANLTVYWQKAKGMLLESHLIFTKTMPNWLKAFVTSSSSFRS